MKKAAPEGQGETCSSRRPPGLPFLYVEKHAPLMPFSSFPQHCIQKGTSRTLLRAVIRDVPVFCFPPVFMRGLIHRIVTQAVIIRYK